ncbi:MAG: carbohydrate porin [Betaproteobacteria bacterium]|nr:carbohydrate porin [Betaproteobacteria bacterium]
MDRTAGSKHHVHRHRARAMAAWSLALAVGAAAAAAAPASAAAMADAPADAPPASPVNWTFSLDSEIVDNLGGGIAPGSVGDTLARLGFVLDGGAAGLAQGSRIKATLQRTQSGQPSATRIGDAQSVTNIEAPSRSRVYELWYGQPAGRNWELRAGLIAADAHFDVLDSAGLLFNGSFGAEPIWSGNTVAPIFPVSGIGAMATWHSGAWTSRSGVFQADPQDRSSAFRRGQAWMEEGAYHGSGTYKLGAWSYRPDGSADAQLPRANWGTYFSADQPLEGGDNPPSAFLRAGWSPRGVGAVDYDLQAGLLVPGPLAGRAQDQFSLGLARARFRGLGTETTYEATYQIALAPHLALQPDLQYVVHPGGILPSALVASLRLHVGFE